LLSTTDHYLVILVFAQISSIYKIIYDSLKIKKKSISNNINAKKIQYFYKNNYQNKSMSTLGIETEGYEGKILKLYHMTSTRAADSIVSQQYMMPGSKGMFGPAIYFAKTKKSCQRKARHTEVLLIAKVEVGKSLICRKAAYYLNLDTISALGCHSAKGVGCVSTVEYAIYHPIQITRIKIVPTFPFYKHISFRIKNKFDGCGIQ